MTDPYSVGTVSVLNGGTTVTGTGTFWVGKVRKNDMFFDPAQGLQARVTADPTDNEELAITAWAGTALSDDAYEIIPQGDSTTNTARLRELLAQMSVVEANGRGLFYRFSDTTTDADPGAGYIRFNQLDLTTATAAYIDVLDANGGTVSGEIDTWDDSTSLGKGNLWVRSIADPTAFRAYAVTGSVVDGSGYRKLTLTHIGGSGSFAADDELMVAFARTGDAGDGYITDATVADPSELTALEGEAAGYLVFVTDLETDFGAYSGRSGVVELIAGPDWQLVAVYTGPQGIQGIQGVQGIQGERGINWQGDYSGAAAYAEDDGVLYNGSSWRALGATTGNAPPTLPATSNAYWQLLARQGIDGAGTVNSVVAGTGIAVDNTDPTAPEVSIPVEGVVNAMLANMAEATIKGRASGAGTGVPTDLSASQVRMIARDPMLHVVDQKATGTAGGSASVSYQQRVLNTVLVNQITGASLASNLITLPAGSYYVEALAPGIALNGNRILLHKNIEDEVVLQGGNVYGNAAAFGGTVAPLTGNFTLGSTTTLQLLHYAQAAYASDGLGLALNVSGEPEIYAQVKIWKRD